MHSEIDYVAGVRWRDAVRVAVECQRIGTTSFTLGFSVLRRNGGYRRTARRPRAERLRRGVHRRLGQATDTRAARALRQEAPRGTVVAWARSMITSVTFRPAWPSNSIWPTPEWCRSGTARFLTEVEQLESWRPDVAIVGAPFDIATTNRPGARFGPRAIRATAYEPGTYHLDLGLEIFDWLEVVDFGDAYCPHGQTEVSHAQHSRTRARGGVARHRARRPRR